MSRNRTKSRVRNACGKPQSMSRHNCLDTPVWLLLYYLDIEIVNSGYFRRRWLLRVRNLILWLIGSPCGDIWSVHVPKQNKNKELK